MASSFLAFIFNYKSIILFYLALALLLYIKRKKLAIYAKFIILYRMKWGLKWMDRCSRKYREWIILLGYVGTGIGFIGMVLISLALVKLLIDALTTPAAVQGVSLVLPGINIPGLGILPFWDWLIAIFIIALVHEFAHGIVARAHDITVKNTGILVFGPILGAFVEPDEQKIRKEKDIVQYSVFAAGSFSNILLAIAALVLLLFAFAPLQNSMVEPQGFTFDGYYGEDLPAAQAGIPPGAVIMGIENYTITSFQEFAPIIDTYSPGDAVTLHTPEKSYALTLAENPDEQGKPFLGIQSIHNEFEVKEQYSSGFWKGVYYSNEWLTGFLRILYVLSLGIGLFNLLPLPIVDGGRMAQTFLHKLKGPETGERRYRQISLFLLLVLILNLIYPLLLKLF